MPHLAFCPSCSATLRIPDGIIKPQITCPRCLAAVDNPAAARAAPPADVPPLLLESWAEDEARIDSTRSGVLIIILAILGGVGLVPQILGALGQAFGEGDPRLLLFTAGGLLFLMLISAVIVFFRSRGNPKARGFGRIVVGTLAMAGVLMAISFVVALAFVIYLFVACFDMVGRF